MKDVDPLSVNLIAIWVETVLFGIYTTLFFESITIMFKRWSVRPKSAQIFSGVMVLMYVITVAHVGSGLYRLIKGYTWIHDPDAQLRYWSILFARPMEMTMYYSLQSAMTGIADILLVYRCFIIWGRNYWICIPGFILCLAGIGIGIATNVLWASTGYLHDTHYVYLVNAIFPISIAQNVSTTGLIIYRLAKQHQRSFAAGLHDEDSRLSLKKIGMILIESAAIFTFQQVLTLIFYIMNNDVQFIFINTITPTIGITWSLIAVRLHRVTVNASRKSTVFTLSAPQWARTEQETMADISQSQTHGDCEMELGMSTSTKDKLRSLRV